MAQSRKHCPATLRPIAAAIIASLSSLAMGAQPAPTALPTDGKVAAGAATITQNAASMTINQASNRAVINWNTFNIGSQASVVFNQPSASAIAMNRVLSSDPSAIFGRLSANGQIFLVNPAGVLFGPGASVNTAGLVTSTLGLSDQNFMSGNYRFERNGATGTIVNQGTLTSSGGYIALLAPEVRNEGVIMANLGSVAMAAGEVVTLSFDAGNKLSVAVNPSTLKTLIENKHIVQANGGSVLMASSAATDVLGSVIRNTGVIEATSIGALNGEVTLSAGGGTTLLDGTGRIDVRGMEAGQSGGTVKLLGDRVGLFGQSAVDASGAAGGGTVLVGGDYKGANAAIYNATRTYVGPEATIKADALGNGDGGKVIVWSDYLTGFYGSIQARGGALGGNGGFVETSGKQILIAEGQVNASAPLGRTGQWLLDPFNVTISNRADASPASWIDNFSAADNGANVNAGSIQTALSNGTSVIISTGSSGVETGNITVAGSEDSLNGAVAIDKVTGGDASLTLRAAGSIFVNSGARISSTSGALHVTLNSRNDNGIATPEGAILIGSATINSNGGNIIMGGGTDPLTGAAIGTSFSPDGIRLAGTTLSSGAGNISLRGEGSVFGGNGIFSNALIDSTSGAISLYGTGHSGVTVANFASTVGSRIGTQNGAINITGIGTSSGENVYGIHVLFGATIASTGSGNIVLTGTGGVGPGGSNDGIRLSGEVLSSGSGAISLTGTGGLGGGFNAGVRIFGTVDASGTGAINVFGTGGDSPALNGNNDGLFLSGLVSSTTGAINLSGTGRGAGANNDGVFITTSCSEFCSGPTTSISAGSAASIAITGTGGALGSGIVLLDTAISGAGGPITLRSEAGALTASGSIVQTTGGSGQLQLLADKMDLATSTISSGAGGILLAPVTVGTAINLGSTVDTTANTLELSNTELAMINTPGPLLISNCFGSCSAPTVPSAPITVSAAVTTNPTGGGGTTLVSNSSGIVINDVLTSGAGAQPLTLVSGGTIIESGAGRINTTGTLTARSVGGQTLNGANRVSTFLADNSGTGSIAFTNTAALTIAGLSNTAANGDITVINFGAINTTGAITSTPGGNVSVTALGGALTLGTLNVGSLTATSNGALNLGQGTVASTLTANSNNSLISQSGALNVAGASSLNAGTGGILLNAANDFTGAVTPTGGTTQITDINALNLGTLATGAFTANAGGALNLGQGFVAGTLTANSASGGVSQTGPITVTGASNIQAGSGAITLVGANDFQGLVNLGGGAATINDVNALNVSMNTTGDGSVTSAGTLILGGVVGGNLAAASNGGAVSGLSLTVGGATSVNAGANTITLAGASDFAGPVNLVNTGANTIQVTDVSALQLGTVSTAGNLTVNAVGIGQTAGGLNVGGISTFNAGGGAIALNAANNTLLGAVSLNNSGANNVSLSNNTATVLGTSALSSGTLNVTANGTITQTGALTQAPGAGTATFNAGSNAIALTNPANNFTGLVSLTGSTVDITDQNQLNVLVNATGAARVTGNLTYAGTSGDLTLNAQPTPDGTLTFGQTAVNGNLVAAAAGAVSQIAGTSLNVTGTSNINAGANTQPITLNNTGNHFGTLATFGGSTINVADSAALNAVLNGTGLATLSSAGAMTVSGVASGIVGTAGTTMTVGAAGLNSGAGAMQLVSPGNLTLNGLVSSSAAGNSVNLVSTAGNFINNFGANAVSVPADGRFLIYSTSPQTDSTGGLTAPNIRFGTNFGDAIAFTGSGFLYSSGQQSVDVLEPVQALQSAIRSPDLVSWQVNADLAGAKSPLFVADKLRVGSSVPDTGADISCLTSTEDQPCESERRRARTARYKNALEVLRKSPTVADLPLCGPNQPELCMPNKPGVVADAAQGVLELAIPVSEVRKKVALLIGNNDYREGIPQLETPISDVTAIGKVLAERMGYEVTILKNARKADMVKTLKALAEQTTQPESVLIFYAGHGYQMDDTKAGFWMPSDASASDPRTWVSNNDIQRFLNRIDAKQIMVVADSCFSGTLTKEQSIDAPRTAPRAQLLSRRAVVTLSSGDEEPVTDEGLGGHSIFAYHFLGELRRIQTMSPASVAYERLRENVARAHPQTPQLGGVRSAGHMTGANYLLEVK